MEALVREALAHLGGMSQFVKPGQTVLIKPNQTVYYSAEEGCTDARAGCDEVASVRALGHAQSTIWLGAA
jgi:uncharacterized protein (DUF362 family)